jgi:hypothetical protein
MKHDSTFQDGIHASLKAMHKMLVAATEETQAACGHIARNEQNMAIGTVMVVEDLLAQATIIYQAVIAMHRCRL